jgi:heme oxygenase
MGSLKGRPLLLRLRAETEDLHRRAETHVRILDADASEADYRTYLRAMRGFHAPVERALRVLDGDGFASASRGKTAWLDADLAALADADPPLVCAALPALGDRAAAVGGAYVLEGSTLGGRYILSRLPAALAPLRGRATAFLHGYGDDTGAQWRRFGEVVERVLVDDAAAARAIEGARDTFARLIDWLIATAADGGRADPARVRATA